MRELACRPRNVCEKLDFISVGLLLLATKQHIWDLHCCVATLSSSHFREFIWIICIINNKKRPILHHRLYQFILKLAWLIQSFCSSGTKERKINLQGYGFFHTFTVLNWLRWSRNAFSIKFTIFEKKLQLSYNADYRVQW